MANRDKLLNIRVSEAERRMLEAVAEAEGINVSDLIRQFIRRSYRKLFGSLIEE